MEDQKQYFHSLLLESMRDTSNPKKVIRMFNRLCEDNYPLKLNEMVDRYQATLLHYAATYGNDSIVRYLLESNCNIDAQDERGKSPLMLALQNDRHDAVKILLKSNANIHITDNHGKSSLQLIFDSKNSLYISMLFRFVTWERIIKGIAPEVLVKKLQKARYTVKEALDSGSTELLKVYLDSSFFAIDTRDYGTKYTLLHKAARSGMMDMAKVLIECGADVDALDCWDATPLYYLCSEDRVSNPTPKFLEVLKMLVSRAELFTKTTDHGPMLIRKALVCGTSEVIEVILSAKIKMDVLDGWSHSARDYLHWNHMHNTCKKMWEMRE